MNMTNDSSSSQMLQTAKASFYLLDFLICSVFSILITQTVWKDSVLKKEVRYFFLCHHLMYLTSFFCLGTIFSYFRAFQVNAPVLVCWLIFAVQIMIGRAVLLTLVLMALNTCIAVCWPLNYLRFVHSVKHKVIVCSWIIALLDPTVSLVYESIQRGHRFIVQLDPTCPITLSSTLARIAGVTFIIISVTLIIGSYIILFREGKRAGHFTKSNHQARRTILIHGLQVTLHIIPTLLSIWIGGKPEYIIFDLINFIIFSLAQCLSPVIYGLRCTELRHKVMKRQFCCGTLDRYNSDSFQNEHTTQN